MLAKYIPQTITRLLTSYVHSFVRAARRMWDSVVRFGFGPPGRSVDEETPDEETTNVKPVKSPQDGAPDMPLLHEQTRSHDCTMANDSYEFASSPPKAPDVSQHSSYSTEIESHIPSHIPEGNMSFRSFLKKAKDRRKLMRIELPSDVANPDSDHAGLLANARRVSFNEAPPEDDHDYITLTTSEDQTDMAVLLTPIRGKLQKLRETTPDSLPPYNPSVRAKTHAQVLKVRLLPIGEFIVHELLAKVPAEKRGILELKLCRYIADEYWPLPEGKTTHIHVQAMYRNVMFKEAVLTARQTHLQTDAIHLAQEALVILLESEMDKRDSGVDVDGMDVNREQLVEDGDEGEYLQLKRFDVKQSGGYSGVMSVESGSKRHADCEDDKGENKEMKTRHVGQFPKGG
ncbi:hypothetical protein P153DRAFT_390406 [Dothidotthia symphoricarpi CBS 119687]|uniref:Chromodomain-helicase-DNA-binding protein 1-like C-terminal domain-containing protein n=1 Tax=Dothidotthia symphoricarpi CBS 119687 TaxID=1392245 RepID=A0A6A5ZXW0_9PLEO|nr:uncharacterized protein P153DRAFT_390406 [Dothidotthia symphoricarpi CBS 119687]KAF2124369.1 hypothetical protein P153DRAFT_390406 [Dothidotthia symphoricarpi CBS 119687]